MVVAHAFNSGRGRGRWISMSSRPAWPIRASSRTARTNRKILPQKTNKQTKKKTNKQQQQKKNSKKAVDISRLQIAKHNSERLVRTEVKWFTPYRQETVSS